MADCTSKGAKHECARHSLLRQSHIVGKRRTRTFRQTHHAGRGTFVGRYAFDACQQCAIAVKENVARIHALPLYSYNPPSGKTTPSNLALRKRARMSFASTNAAEVKSAPVRSASCRLALLRSARCKSAFCKFAPHKSVSTRLAFAKLAFCRFAWLRSAKRASASEISAPCKFAPAISAPTKLALVRIA